MLMCPNISYCDILKKYCDTNFFLAIPIPKLFFILQLPIALTE